jgi:hypothetical protein
MDNDDLSEVTVCGACGGPVALQDHGGHRKLYRRVEVAYPHGVRIPTCAQCGATWLDERLTEVLGAAFEQQRAALLRRAKTG